MIEKGNDQIKKHALSVSTRQHISISGVTEVESFDEQTVALDTHAGRLVITGAGLHVDSLQPAEERMTISGTIDGAAWEDGGTVRRRGFLRQALGR